MASVEQRGPATWRVGVRTSVELGRKWIRRTITFPEDMPLDEQRARAELAAAQLQLDVAQGKVGRDKRTTVADFADIWMNQHVKPSCKPTTAKTYASFLNARIIPRLGSMALADLTPLIITQFLNDLREDTAISTAIQPELRVRVSDRAIPLKPPRPLSDRTIRHYYDCLRDMLNMAVKWDFLSKNPIEKVAPPKFRKSRIHYLDDRQAVQLLRCLSEVESLSFRCAVLLALLCGLRLGEVCALTFDDIDWKDCSIHVSRGMSYTPATGSYFSTPKSEAGDRVVDLPAGMMALLEEARKLNDEHRELLGRLWIDSNLIVHSWNGAPLHHDTPSKWFRKFADANGFTGVRFHDLRHTHATLLFANNIDAVAIASRLGHEDASTTLRIYAHAIRRRDLESARAMQSLLDTAFPPLPDPDQDH